MMKSLIACAIGVLVFAPAAFADQVVWKSTGRVNDWDWSEGGNFEGGSAPKAGDTVVLPKSTDIFVQDADSMALVSSLEQVMPTDARSRIVFVVPEDMTWTVEKCAICSAAKHEDSKTDVGKIVKRGTGKLVLARADGYPEINSRAPSYTDRQAYKTGLVVEEGELKLPTTQETGGYSHNFGPIAVSNGAVLCTVTGKGNYTVPTSIWGEGVITNSDSSTRNFRVNGTSADYSLFSGQLAGNVNYMSWGRVDLTGTNNVNCGVLSYGVKIDLENYSNVWTGTGIRKIGRLSESATMPKSKKFETSTNGGRYIFIGDESETTDRPFYMGNPKDGPSVFDAGPHGGVTFTGRLYGPLNGANAGMGRFGLCGSNSVPCVIAGAVGAGETASISGTNDIFFVKKGAGTWRFADSATAANNANRTFATSLTVDEGTLQFDSIAEAGSPCSLGFATNTAVAYNGVYDPAKLCPYAFFAGAKDGPATLEYTGTNAFVVTTRPIAMTGDLMLLNNTTHPTRFAGVTNDTEKAVTLTLAGSCSAENELAGVADTSDEPVSIVKDGAGTWILNGSNTIHGTICVKEGTLGIRRVDAPYTWFRWTVRGKNVPSSNCNMYFTELGVYDAAGQRLNAKLQVSGGDPLELTAGSVAMGCPGMSFSSASRGLSNLFEGGSSFAEGYRDGVSLSVSNPKTWIPFVMRLTNGTESVAVGYDFCSSSRWNDSSNGKRVPNSWQMEGSVDAIHWDLLSETNGVQLLATTWAGNGKSYGGDKTDLPHENAMPLSSGLSTIRTTVLDDVTAVSVAAGATLEALGGTQMIRGLKVDAAGGMGTIDGFAFAEEGTIDVENAVRGREMNVAATFANAVDLGNVNGWNVTLGGQPSGYKVKATESGLTIIPPGLVLIIR